MIDAIAKTITSERRLPLSVAEDAFQTKLQRIKSNAYLRHCYDMLGGCSGSISIFGHSADPIGAHIYSAIFRSKVERLFDACLDALLSPGSIPAAGGDNKSALASDGAMMLLAVSGQQGNSESIVRVGKWLGDMKFFMRVGRTEPNGPADIMTALPTGRFSQALAVLLTNVWAATKNFSASIFRPTSVSLTRCDDSGTLMTIEYATSLILQFGHRMVDPEAFDKYMERHDIRAAANLTVQDDEVASLIAERLADRIAGKTVIEIGGGTGLLALHLADHAKRVFCIEVNPVWALLHLEMFTKRKPKNLNYLFGSAEEFSGVINGDVALICTHSAVTDMIRTASKFVPEVIDVYGELVKANPEAFDAWAREARLRS